MVAHEIQMNEVNSRSQIYSILNVYREMLLLIIICVSSFFGGLVIFSNVSEHEGCVFVSKNVISNFLFPKKESSLRSEPLKQQKVKGCETFEVSFLDFCSKLSEMIFFYFRNVK